MDAKQKETYSKIIERAWLKLIKWKDGKFWFVDKEDNIPVNGPFNTEDDAKLFLIDYEGTDNE